MCIRDRGRSVLLCGLAYKADTSDARETPTRAIVAGLLSLGCLLYTSELPTSDLV